MDLSPEGILLESGIASNTKCKKFTPSYSGGVVMLNLTCDFLFMM
jgi:hypothetical protein